MSGGQQQRVAIARALVGDRRLVLADEPTGALDSETGEAVLRLLRARCDAGAAGVLVTHEARHAAWADRVVFLRDGLMVDETGADRRPSRCSTQAPRMRQPAPRLAPAALRIARRDALRAKGRSALVLVMIGLPVLAVVGADVLGRTADVTTVEGLDRQMGHADAVVRWNGDRSPVDQSPYAGHVRHPAQRHERPATAHRSHHHRGPPCRAHRHRRHRTGRRPDPGRRLATRSDGAGRTAGRRPRAARLAVRPVSPHRR